MRAMSDRADQAQGEGLVFGEARRRRAAWVRGALLGGAVGVLVGVVVTGVTVEVVGRKAAAAAPPAAQPPKVVPAEWLLRRPQVPQFNERLGGDGRLYEQPPWPSLQLGAAYKTRHEVFACDDRAALEVLRHGWSEGEQQADLERFNSLGLTCMVLAADFDVTVADAQVYETPAGRYWVAKVNSPFLAHGQMFVAASELYAPAKRPG